MKEQQYTPLTFFLSVCAPALQLQYILGFGYLAALLVSIFYYFVNDGLYPKEQPHLLVFAALLSFGCWLLGTELIRRFSIRNHLSLRRGAWIMALTWVIACTISAMYFVWSGFPIPDRVNDFSLLRRIIDGWYESMSGFTTTGASVLPSVEAFPRGMLFWRSITHWFGGMGIAYMAMTLWKTFMFKRGPIINAEAESPNHTDFHDEKEAIQSGVDFLKAYVVLTSALFVLLVISGLFFRETPYPTFHQNIYESLNYSMSTLGTGGFGIHDASEGLPIFEDGQLVIGGLRNKVSDWIIGIFMFFCGMNFGLWYLIIFKGKWREALENTELRIYFILCTLITVSIFYYLVKYNVYSSALESLRYALFNMATIVSTTGLANWDFHKWPAEAQGILFVAYLLGGCVGSTAGGLKVTRYIVAVKYLYNELRSLIVGEETPEFIVDGVTYTKHTAGLITATMTMYYLLFLGGAILLMVISPNLRMPDGTFLRLDFTTAIASSIANLGNIGPAVALGSINAGPTGNYFAVSDLGKVLLIFLMFVGRVGILSTFMLFITKRGEKAYYDSVPEIEFDAKHPQLRR